MKRSMKRALGAAVVVVGLLVGCQDSKPKVKQVYYPKLVAPVGIAVQVVKDLNMDRLSGGTIQVVARVDPDLDRDELNRLMRSFYRQARSRRRFRGHKAAEDIEITLAPSADPSVAKDGWLGKVVDGPLDDEPVFKNRQKPPLLKWVNKALGPQPQYTGEAKPRILVDPDALGVDLRMPMVKLDGSGNYVDEPTYQRATTAFSSTAIALFHKIDALQYLTFAAVFRGEDVLRVQLSRREYKQVNLMQVEQNLGELRGLMVEEKMAGRLTDARMTKRLSKRRRRLYGEVFALLPKRNVFVSPTLR